MRQRLILTLLILTSFLAVGAQRRAPVNTSTTVSLTTPISASDMDAASHTAAIDGDQLDGFGLLTLFVDILDANDTVTLLSIECFGKKRGAAGNSYRIPVCIWDTVNTRYNCEAGPLAWNPSDETSSDTKSQGFRIDVESYANASCTITDTGGVAADKLTVTAEAAVKG